MNVTVISQYATQIYRKTTNVDLNTRCVGASEFHRKALLFNIVLYIAS